MGDQMRGVWELSALSLQIVCQSKTIIKFKNYLKIILIWKYQILFGYPILHENSSWIQKLTLKMSDKGILCDILRTLLE